MIEFYSTLVMVGSETSQIWDWDSFMWGMGTAGVALLVPYWFKRRKLREAEVGLNYRVEGQAQIIRALESKLALQEKMIKGLDVDPRFEPMTPIETSAKISAPPKEEIADVAAPLQETSAEVEPALPEMQQDVPVETQPEESPAPAVVAPASEAAVAPVMAAEPFEVLVPVKAEVQAVEAPAEPPIAEMPEAEVVQLTDTAEHPVAETSAVDVAAKLVSQEDAKVVEEAADSVVAADEPDVLATPPEDVSLDMQIEELDRRATESCTSKPENAERVYKEIELFVKKLLAQSEFRLALKMATCAGRVLEMGRPAPSDAQRAEAMHLWAQTALAAGELKDALAIAEEAYSLRKHSLTWGHQHTLSSLALVAKIKTRLSRQDVTPPALPKSEPQEAEAKYSEAQSNQMVRYHQAFKSRPEGYSRRRKEKALRRIVAAE